MRILELRERTLPIASSIANAYIDFSQMTLSLVALVTDVVREGRRVVGYGFNSNGRYGQGGLIRERFAPRLLAARNAELPGIRFESKSELIAVMRTLAEQRRSGRHRSPYPRATSSVRAVRRIDGELPPPGDQTNRCCGDGRPAVRCGLPRWLRDGRNRPRPGRCVRRFGASDGARIASRAPPLTPEVGATLALGGHDHPDAPLRRLGGTAASPRPPPLDMRLAGSSALFLFALVAACGADSATAPADDALAPAVAERTLTGATSIEVLPEGATGLPIRSDARGLNASGQVTGAQFGLTPLTEDFRPYRSTPGAAGVPLEGCCGTQWGADINDAGVVVGIMQTGLLEGTRGFVATGSSMVALPILPDADPEGSAGAVAINDAGQIVGYSPSATGRHAVLWNASGIIHDLGTLGGSTSEAIDVNASGLVIGKSLTAGDAATHFFLWSPETGMVDLETQLGAITSVVEINNNGQIIGTYDAAGGASHAFLYTPGFRLRDLGTLGGRTSEPTGLNDAGQVVGSSTLADGSAHAFLWTPTDGMDDITAVTGIRSVRRLNDKLQTLAGPVVAPTSLPGFETSGDPLLVQLAFAPTSSRATR